MKKIKLKNTNITMSRLGFGTASIHHIMKKSKRLDLLAYAYELGFTHFDTARMYGDGIAEKTLGEYFEPSKRDKITITTKFGIDANPIYETMPLLMYSSKFLNNVSLKLRLNIENRIINRNLSIDNVEKSLEKSLKLLRTDRIDIYTLHEAQIEDIAYLDDLVVWLEKQKKIGKILNIGISGNAGNCVKIAKKFPSIFTILQVEDSLDKNEADILLTEKLPLQITFGYMRLAQNGINKNDIIKNALKRNKEGSILVSSRKKQNLANLINVVNNFEENK